jgi:NAD(P)-dependent dehydrogenase (short-subunit alcohol dehydrogenase family)
MGKLDGKIALVTGGGAGIGKGITLKLASVGAQVIIVGRREEVLKETSSLNDNITYIVGDITNDNTIQDIVNMINNKFNGRLDILVNNAGSCPIGYLKDMTIEDYDKTFNLDVRALVNLTIKTLPFIMNTKGNIINISTVGATHRSANLSLYTGAKAAVENFTRCWALELATDGVRVNAIAPGAIDTDIWDMKGVSEEEKTKHREFIESTIPCKRFGSPEEIANVALFLVSDEASYINGAIIAVDGAQGAA